MFYDRLTTHLIAQLFVHLRSKQGESRCTEAVVSTISSSPSLSIHLGPWGYDIVIGIPAEWDRGGRAL